MGAWAHKIYLECCGKIDEELEHMIYQISLMDAGPEFELTIDELYKLADKLIAEGEKEELSKPISEISIAMDLGDNWLMRPLCQEAWESYCEYAIVFCPKCNQKLHNKKLRF